MYIYTYIDERLTLDCTMLGILYVILIPFSRNDAKIMKILAIAEVLCRLCSGVIIPRRSYTIFAGLNKRHCTGTEPYIYANGNQLNVI